MLKDYDIAKESVIDTKSAEIKTNNKMSRNDKLSLLLLEINFALDTGNKELFVKLTGEYNTYKKEDLI